MSSKKAKRKKEYLERVKKRNMKKEREVEYRKIMDTGSMKDMAKFMGIKLQPITLFYKPS